MCLPQQGEGHECVPECLPCKALALDNLRHLLWGGRVPLGTVGDLKILSARGCMLCNMVLAQFQGSQDMRDSSQIHFHASFNVFETLSKLKFRVTHLALSMDEAGIYKMSSVPGEFVDVDVTYTGKTLRGLLVNSPGGALDVPVAIDEPENHRIVEIALPVYEAQDSNLMNENSEVLLRRPLGGIVMHFTTAETGAKARVSQVVTDQPVTSSHEEPSVVSSALVYEDWCRLLSNYSHVNSLKRTENLSSLSTIAEEYSRMLREPYLAGLWKGMLPFGLLWHHSSRKSQSGELGEVGSMAYPSWSPFSNKGPVAFHFPDHLCYEDGGKRPSLVTLHSATTVAQNVEARFGPLADWSLEISAPMKCMSWKQVNKRFRIITEGLVNRDRDCILADNGNLNIYLGPMAGFQAAAPGSNPGVPDKVRPTVVLPERADNDIGRSNPPDRRHVPFLPFNVGEAAAAGGDALAALRPSTEFWFLEIVHTHVPVGLVLVRVVGNSFKRVGMFYMGAETEPQTMRKWDWQGGLQMRTCVLV